MAAGNVTPQVEQIITLKTESLVWKMYFTQMFCTQSTGRENLTASRFMMV